MSSRTQFLHAYIYYLYLRHSRFNAITIHASILQSKIFVAAGGGLWFYFTFYVKSILLCVNWYITLLAGSVQHYAYLGPPNLLFIRFKKVLNQYLVWDTTQDLKFSSVRISSPLKPQWTPLQDNYFSVTLLLFKEWIPEFL
jgi:hypothetical protein